MIMGLMMTVVGCGKDSDRPRFGMRVNSGTTVRKRVKPFILSYEDSVFNETVSLGEAVFKNHGFVTMEDWKNIYWDAFVFSEGW